VLFVGEIGLVHAFGVAAAGQSLKLGLPSAVLLQKVRWHLLSFYIQVPRVNFEAQLCNLTVLALLKLKGLMVFLLTILIVIQV